MRNSPPPSLESLLSNEFPAMRERKEERRRREASGEEYSEKETYGKEGKKPHGNFENTSCDYVECQIAAEGGHPFIGFRSQEALPPKPDTVLFHDSFQHGTSSCALFGQEGPPPPPPWIPLSRLPPSLLLSLNMQTISPIRRGKSLAENCICS